MKRSEINTVMQDVDAFLHDLKFHLPPWAYWSVDEWKARKSDAQEVIDRRLGWDITDFGQGDYARIGLFVFTMRNGALET